MANLGIHPLCTNLGEHPKMNRTVYTVRCDWQHLANMIITSVEGSREASVVIHVLLFKIWI